MRLCYSSPPAETGALETETNRARQEKKELDGHIEKLHNLASLLQRTQRFDMHR
jgi:hypothetical protein